MPEPPTPGNPSGLHQVLLHPRNHPTGSISYWAGSCWWGNFMVQLPLMQGLPRSMSWTASECPCPLGWTRPEIAGACRPSRHEAEPLQPLTVGYPRNPHATLCPPGVIGDQGGVPKPPGAEAHSVVDDLDCGEVWLLPPQPDGRGTVGFGVDMGRGKRGTPLDGQVCKVKNTVKSGLQFWVTPSVHAVSWEAPFPLHRQENRGCGIDAVA